MRVAFRFTRRRVAYSFVQLSIERTLLSSGKNVGCFNLDGFHVHCELHRVVRIMMEEEAPKPKQKRKKRGGYFMSKNAIPGNFRPIVESYYHLCSKYPRERWEEFSYRKQVCLRYIEWLVYPADKGLRGELIDKVKEWRKEEGGRLGGKRSILEKLARRFFKTRRREKVSEKNRKRRIEIGEETLKNELGIFRPDLREKWKTSENARRLRSFQEKAGCALYWTVYSPDGQVFHIHSLRRFCRENNLDDSHLGKTSLYPGKYHKGWRAVKRNPDVEKVLDELK